MKRLLLPLLLWSTVIITSGEIIRKREAPTTSFTQLPTTTGPSEANTSFSGGGSTSGQPDSGSGGSAISEGSGSFSGSGSTSGQPDSGSGGSAISEGSGSFSGSGSPDGSGGSPITEGSGSFSGSGSTSGQPDSESGGSAIFEGSGSFSGSGSTSGQPNGSGGSAISEGSGSFSGSGSPDGSGGSAITEGSGSFSGSGSTSGQPDGSGGSAIPEGSGSFSGSGFFFGSGSTSGQPDGSGGSASGSGSGSSTFSGSGFGSGDSDTTSAPINTSPFTTVTPAVLVNIDDLTAEQKENLVTIVFRGLNKEQFAERVISFFGEAVINIVNDYLMNKDNQRVKRQQPPLLSPEDVVIIEPLLQTNGGLEVTFVVGGGEDQATLISGGDLISLLEVEGNSLATELKTLTGLQMIEFAGAQQFEPLTIPIALSTTEASTTQQLGSEVPAARGLTNGAIVGIVFGTLIAVAALSILLIAIAIVVYRTSHRRLKYDVTQSQSNRYLGVSVEADDYNFSTTWQPMSERSAASANDYGSRDTR